MNLLEPRAAHEFLNTFRKKRLLQKVLRLGDMLPSRDVGMDNANEECCLEGCNTEEILEYACWNAEMVENLADQSKKNMKNFRWGKWENLEISRWRKWEKLKISRWRKWENLKISR